jgi:hypothetical protein
VCSALPAFLFLGVVDWDERRPSETKNLVVLTDSLVNVAAPFPGSTWGRGCQGVGEEATPAGKLFERLDPFGGAWAGLSVQRLTV